MNTTLWILQGLVAFVFMYSGINKTIFSEQKLVASGQTGVEGLPLPLIRFIGISEMLGAAGIIIPWYFQPSHLSLQHDRIHHGNTDAFLRIYI